MQMNYRKNKKKKIPETKCKTCLGCNRLEDENFKEVYRCENYVKGKEKVRDE